MKVVALIPVKLNNQRIPGKNTKCFSDGTPLISLIQRACLNSETIDETYVYCSNGAIKAYLEKGIQFIKRPEYLDSDAVNSNDIIKEFIETVDADIYVETHATGPFTKGKSIDACVNAVKSGKYDSAFLAKRIQEFLWQNGKALNFDVQHFPRTQDLVPVYSEAPGAYVFTKGTFLKYGRRVGIEPYIHEVSEIESRDIDYPEDFAIADALYMSILRGGYRLNKVREISCISALFRKDYDLLGGAA